MENFTEQTFIILAIASIISLGIGIFIGRVSISGASEAAISDTQKELEDYKKSVSEHFGKTADLVDNLSESYKDVFDHLGSSAKSLLSEEQVNKHIASRADKAITLSYASKAEKKSTKKSATEKAAPATEKAAPATEKAAPATEKAAPATEKAAPATEKAAPATEKAAPATEKAAHNDSVKLVTKTPESSTRNTVNDKEKTSEKKSADLLDSISNKTNKPL